MNDEQIIIPGDATKPDCTHEDVMQWKPYNEEVVYCPLCGQIFIPQESEQRRDSMAPDKKTLQVLLKAGPCVHCALGTRLHYDNPDDDPMEIGPFWDAYPDVSFSSCRICGQEWATQIPLGF